MNTEVFRKYDHCLNRYLNVTIYERYINLDGHPQREEGHYLNEEGEKLYRITTKGRTGKTLYYHDCYIRYGREESICGMGGMSGRGWGGRVVGYLTKKEIESYSVEIKNIYA